MEMESRIVDVVGGWSQVAWRGTQAVQTNSSRLLFNTL